MTDQSSSTSRTPTTSATKLASARAYKAANRELLREQQKAYNAERLADPERRKKKLQQDKESRKRNYAKRKAYDEARDKQKYRARNIVRNRIYRGTLTRKPCEKCGLPNAHAHHDDYSKPLEIRWLCPVHHKEAHRVG